MCHQPRFHIRRVSTLQQVDDAAPFQIDRDGAIMLALAKREVVDSQAPHRRLGLARPCRDAANRRVAADRRGHLLCQSSSGRSTRGHAEGSLQRLQPLRRASVRRDEVREPFAEDASGASGVGAEERSDRQSEGELSPDERGGPRRSGGTGCGPDRMRSRKSGSARRRSLESRRRRGVRRSSPFPKSGDRTQEVQEGRWETWRQAAMTRA